MAKTPTMTRAHFQLIADVVKRADLCDSDQEHLASNFADALAMTNPNFDRDRFIEACLGE